MKWIPWQIQKELPLAGVLNGVIFWNDILLYVVDYRYHFDDDTVSFWICIRSLTVRPGIPRPINIPCGRSIRRAWPANSLQWRHNGRDGVSNYQSHDCLLNRLFKAQKKKNQSSASLAFVRGIHRWPLNSPHKGPIARKMFPFDDVIMSWWRHGTHIIFLHLSNMILVSSNLAFFRVSRPAGILLTWINLIPASINNHMPSKVWDEMT